MFSLVIYFHCLLFSPFQYLSVFIMTIIITVDYYESLFPDDFYLNCYGKFNSGDH